MADLACRYCRVPMDAEGGCAMCSDFRKHLISVDEDSDARPALSDVTAEAVAGMRSILRRAKPLLGDDDAKVRGRAEATFIGTSNTLAKMVESARKLQTDGFAAIRNMAFAERAALFIDWYTGLAPAHRVRLRGELDKYEKSIAKPLARRELPE